MYVSDTRTLRRMMRLLCTTLWERWGPCLWPFTPGRCCSSISVVFSMAFWVCALDRSITAVCVICFFFLLTFYYYYKLELGMCPGPLNHGVTAVGYGTAPASRCFCF